MKNIILSLTSLMLTLATGAAAAETHVCRAQILKFEPTHQGYINIEFMDFAKERDANAFSYRRPFFALEDRGVALGLYVMHGENGKGEMFFRVDVRRVKGDLNDPYIGVPHNHHLLVDDLRVVNQQQKEIKFEDYILRVRCQ